MDLFASRNTQRREADQKRLERSFERVAAAVLGQSEANRAKDERLLVQDALDEILKYYHLESVSVPENVTETEEQLDYCLNTYGLMRRRIKLGAKWHKDAYGPILARRKEDKVPLALLPRAFRGYYYVEGTSRKRIPITKKNAEMLDEDAICFYLPLPLKKLGLPDLLLFMKRCTSMEDYVHIVVASLATTLVGLLMPRITKALTGPVIASGETRVLLSMAIFIACIAITSQVLQSVQGLIVKRLETKTSLGVQSAIMMRIMSLPTSFFREYSAGELKNRAMAVGQLCEILLSVMTTSVLTSVMSLLYIVQIAQFAPPLAIPSVVAIITTLFFTILTTVLQAQLNKRYMETKAGEDGLSYSLISGIQKIKLAGAEKRAFAKWLDIHADGAALKYDPPFILKMSSVITKAIGLIATVVLYSVSVRYHVGQSSYFAFSAAYGIVMAAFSSLADAALKISMIRPIVDIARPFLECEPEKTTGKEIVTGISGSVWLNHVTFRYSDTTPYILNDINLMINAGEYVAIVGRTGCGKSTLMRLLLGFETPEKGAIFYDTKDIRTLDLPSLRRKIGVVLQSGDLTRGSIYTNITLSAPWLSVDDAWEAAETAAIADDIAAMPMGMHTVVTEGQGPISGGQKQRLLIARAIAPKPALLLLDEATSALDNRTQRQVSEALDAMGCTRIVIAHRLSTIRHCDRIIVLDGGKIVEDGSYEELVNANGFFSELVARQRL